MAGMTGKRRPPHPPRGGRGKQARRFSKPHTERNGSAASNGTHSEHAEQHRPAAEASDSDLDAPLVLDSAAAYGALLGALSSTRTAAGREQSTIAARRHAVGSRSAPDATDQHTHRATGVNGSAAHPDVQSGDARQAASATASLPPAKRKSNGNQVVAQALSPGTASSDPATEAAETHPSAAAAGSAHASGGRGGWGLSLPAEDEDAEDDPARNGGESAVDENPLQDYFGPHLDRCLR